MKICDHILSNIIIFYCFWSNEGIFLQRLFHAKKYLFSHILPKNKKLTRWPHNFIFPLERICLTLQNTLNLEKWQYFNIKNFKFFVWNFMISHLNQYIIGKMTRSYKSICIFLLCMVRFLFSGIKVISRLIGLIYKNMPKMANKIFNVPNHLKCRKLIYFSFGEMFFPNMPDAIGLGHKWSTSTASLKFETEMNAGRYEEVLT